jgi:DNA polymerase-3 subunit gamma/tau
VAAAKPVVSPSQASKSGTSTTSSPAGQTSQTKTNSQPSKPSAPTLKSIGFSWNNLRNNGKPSKINTIPDSIPTTAQPTDVAFTQDDLVLQWLSMCNRMPQEYSGIATRMKNMNPVIVEMPQVEVTVDNELVRQEMDAFKNRIVRTLKDSLHNSQLTLEIRVAEHKRQVVILSRREQFELMTKENPAVEKLRQAFDLELA